VAGHAGDACAIVAGRGGSPGDGRAMTANIAHVRIVVEEIEAGEQVRGKVGVCRVNAGIKDGDRDARAFRDVPCGGSANLRQVPFAAEIGRSLTAMLALTRRSSSTNFRCGLWRRRSTTAVSDALAGRSTM
jgi:hypothetical protein